MSDFAVETRPQSGGVVCGKLGRLGVIRLAYAGTSRQLSLTMRIAAGTAIEGFAADPETYATVIETADGRPFCLGEDVGEIAALAAQGAEALRRALAEAYLALWHFDRFPKPLVTLFEGEVEWAGLALGINGTHKVADPAASFTLRTEPTNAAPGWGASLHLPQPSGSLGRYFALTGAAIDAPLAYRLGWLTHLVPAAEFAGIKQRLAAADPVDSVLDCLDQGGGPSAYDPHLATIESCFSAASPEAILARLKAIRGADEDWADATAGVLQSSDPARLKAVFALAAGPPQPDLRAALTTDFARTFQDLMGQPPSRPLDLPVSRPPSIP